MKIDLSTVQNVAKLARLELTPAELSQLQHNLQAILDYVGQLDGLDLRGVEPTAHPFMNEMRLRDDRAEPFAKTQALLDNAPDHNDVYFKVPLVVGDH